MNDRNHSTDSLAGIMAAGGFHRDQLTAIGRYQAVCRDRDGNTLWEDEFDNLVTTLGKNLLLDSTLAGAAYTVVGPYMGLMGGSAAPTLVASDTMASHPGWTEAGNAAPTYANRLTCLWNAAVAGVKSLSAGLTFTFTGSGTVYGAFIVAGTGALNTNGSGAGVLYSEGALSAPQPVISTNTLTLTYSTTLT